MTTNSAELKPLPCPFCGKASDLEDHDTLYPTGTYWRDDKEIGMRTYHGWRDRKDGDATCWRMHCPVPSGGCGAEIGADSKEEAIAAWNRRTAAQGEQRKCPACNGNDGDMPCAYPSKGMDGCLRDKRLAGSAEQVIEEAAFERFMRSRMFIDSDFRKNEFGQYKAEYVKKYWEVWKARAALSAPERKVTDADFAMVKEWLDTLASQELAGKADYAILEKLRAALNQQGEQTAPEGWISVDDRLPDSDGWYAVIVSDPDDIGWETRCWWRALFKASDGVWNSCDPIDDGQPVTHWMPLPAAPSTAQKDGGME